MPRLPVLIRQNQVFDLVVAGRSYGQICTQLGVSEDTVARDMQAISEQVQALVKERAGEILAVALASYQAVLDQAWREYRADERRERDWYAGRLDLTQETVVIKTLATKDQADDDAPVESESAPLEVKRTQRTIRPALHTNRAQWLKLIIEATREITELMGIKKLIVEHQGDGKPVEHVHMTLDEWKQQAADRLRSAEQTLALLDERDDA
jgi:hypothetical protein